MAQHYLRQLFSPRAIAVFGASTNPDSVGNRVYENLLSGGYSGPVYPINPKYAHVGNKKCYSSIDEIEGTVDLAVIATPRRTIPEILNACGERGVRAAIVLSAGFSDRDEEGAALKQTILTIGREYRIRILGPNCLGLIHPSHQMNATFSKNSASPGHLALISQSGALCTAMLDWAEARGIGFSSIVSLGDAVDIDFGDMLDYLAQDPETRSILLYVEGIRDARGFMSGLRVAARLKPVVILKAGRHREGARAAMTHTGAMVGADDVFDAALQRAGVVRAMTVEQLFSAAQLLASRYRIGGNRLAIISNGGGLGVMATDRALDLGIQLAVLSGQTLEKLNQSLPAYWSRDNPVDLLGDATPGRYEAAVAACLADPGVDGVLVMLSPQAMTDGTACARAVVSLSESTDKPIMACWMGEKQLAEAKHLFARHRLPSFDSPESSIEAFGFLTAYHYSQQLLMQVPAPLSRRSEPDVEGSRLIIEAALSERRNILSITESKAVLRAFSIPVTQSLECRTANEALVAAESLGYPIAMKVHSPDISHKSDAGGIRLNIASAQAVRAAYKQINEEVASKLPGASMSGVTVEPMYSPPHGRELLIGVIRDPVFGPTIAFGAGGVNVEVKKDRSIGLPPINTFLAESMIRQTHVAALLGQYRHVPAVNMDALVQTLRHVSEMICELPEIQAMDINPLVADENGVMALDARIEIERPPSNLDRYGHMAIHPYPVHLVSSYQLADGSNITIRPIRPEDAAIEKRFVQQLSPMSRHFRFMQELKVLTQDMLVRFTQLDYDKELAMIAVLKNGEDVETEIAVARYVTSPDGKSCEFALVVADEWQGKGIGTRLMKSLIDAARQRGFAEMNGEVLADNHDMLQLVRELGFSSQSNRDDPAIKLVSKPL